MDLRAPESLSRRRLKIWIRLLGVTRSGERHLREYLRVEHGTTLPRFDVMAALWRRREGITMSELGRLLLVSGGNVTVIVDGLEREGLVIRAHSSADRRTVAVSLTERGLAEFERIAAGHEAEIDRLFAQLAESDLETLDGIFKRLTKDKT